MRQIVPVRKDQGIPQDKAAEFIQQGWVVMPMVSIRRGGAVATLGNENPTQVDLFDLWCSPAQPMLPELGMAYLLIDTVKEGGDRDTVNSIIRIIFGKDMDVDILEKRVPPRPAPEGS